MKPATCSDDVFQFLVEQRGVDGDGETDLIALFAYALVEQDRIQWASHRRDQGQAIVDTKDVEQWFSDKPEAYFQDKLRRGEEWFTNFARAYLRDEVEADRERAVQQAVGALRSDIINARDKVVNRIDSRTRSKGWSVNIASGLISNFIFAIVIAVLFFTTINKLTFADVVGDIAKGKTEAKGQLSNPP